MVNLFVEELLDLTHLDYSETGLIGGVYVRHSCGDTVFWTTIRAMTYDNYCHFCKEYIVWSTIDLKATRRHKYSISYKKLTDG
jgi:hypothetical protein